jgi:tetratricopeptide (TPR) repeat protein
MGGVRNGNSDTEAGAPGTGQETLAANAHSSGAEGEVHGKVAGHLQVAARLLRERQAAKAFGELVRASRSLVMTRRLAAALVTVSLKAGTEAAAITILSGAIEKLVGPARRDVQRQLARVLRRVEQLPRAVDALESLLAAFPDDYSSRRIYQELLQRMGKWEALVSSLEHEAQEAFKRGEYARAARATRWRARVQAEQLRNLARAAESYGKAATYLEQMEDADGAFAMRVDGLRVLHSSGASEAVLTAAASVVMSAAARLGRDAQAREVLEELGLIPARPELPPEPEPQPEPQPEPPRAAPVEPPVAPAAKAAPANPQANTPWSRPTRLDVPIAKAESQPVTPGTRITKPEFPAAAAEAPASDTHPTSIELPVVTPGAPAAELRPPPAPIDPGASTPPVATSAVPPAPAVNAAPAPAVNAAPAPAVDAAPAPAASVPSAPAASVPPASAANEAPSSAASASPSPVASTPTAPVVSAPSVPAVSASPAPAVSAPPTPVASTPPAPAASAPPPPVVSAPPPPVASPPPASASAASPQPSSKRVESNPWTEERTEAGAPPPAPAKALSAEDDDFAAPEDVEDKPELESSDEPPLTELFDLPDEGDHRPAPPVAFDAQEERPAPRSEPPPPPPAASEDRDDSAAQQRLESQLIARKAWRELAQFYLARAERAKDPTVRAEALTRLAEVMETELNDPAGAARMYREIVTLTGDRTALKEQVRLLAQRGNPDLVRRALDEAVHGARTPKARADAYLTRAELSLEAGERVQAKADFETAEALTPGLMLVLAGLVRCVSDAERPAAAQRMRNALTAAPRRSPDRLEALRVLASVAEDLLKDERLAQWAWTEVLAEEPGDSRARERLQALARVLGDKAGLSTFLREQLAREPRGPAARQARLELVATLEAAGDKDGALTELRQAVRFEPGHKEAWLLLADRLIARGQNGEAAWALEHAATAMEDEAERQRTWARLATFCRDVLKDPARAEVYARRAENMRRALEEPTAPPVPEPARGAMPKRDPSTTRTQVLMPAPANLNLTPSGQAFPPMEEPATDTHVPAPPSLPDDARPTIEFSALGTFPGGKMPFSDDEPTATEAPQGFVPPSEPEAPAKAKGAKARSPKAEPPKAEPPKAASSKAPSQLGKKIKMTGLKQASAEPPLDASRELDELLGEVEESPYTSPSLSIWSLKRDTQPDAIAPEPASAKPQKASATLPPAGARKESPVQKGQRSPATSERPGPPVFEDTSPGRKAALNPPPPRALPEAKSRRGAAPTPAAKPQTAAESAFARVSPSEPEPPQPQPSYGSPPVQNTAMISWEAPPGKMEPVRRMARARGGDAPAKVPPAAPSEAEPAVFQQVRENPLEARLYLQIAAYFEQRGDAPRAVLMREIADALDGREGPTPRPPRQPLSADDRSGLRHPLLRTPPGELLACVGLALCSFYPAYGRAAGSQEPVRPDMGVGAPAALEALAATERLLGIQAPEVVLSEDNGPPFSLVFTGKPRMLVGKQAVKQVLPAAELRFYAGRALVCLGPDLLAMRSLKKDQVLRGLAQLSKVLKSGPASSPEALVVYETLQPRQLERAAALFDTATRQFDVSALADAARDSANRAGLIACGAVGPALAALRLKRALEREVIELVRFAASERYFQLCGVR